MTFYKIQSRFFPLFLCFALTSMISGCTKAQLIGAKQLSRVKLFSVSSVSPASGPKSGGTYVSIVGTGFVSGMTITMGNLSCSNVQVVNSTLAFCVTDASPTAGTDSVVIVNGDGSLDNRHFYAYLGTLSASVTRIASGGNALSVGGTGLAKVSARTTIGAVLRKQGNISSGGSGSYQVSVRSGVIGVYSVPRL